MRAHSCSTRPALCRRAMAFINATCRASLTESMLPPLRSYYRARQQPTHLPERSACSGALPHGYFARVCQHSDVVNWANPLARDRADGLDVPQASSKVRPALSAGDAEEILRICTVGGTPCAADLPISRALSRSMLATERIPRCHTSSAS